MLKNLPYLPSPDMKLTVYHRLGSVSLGIVCRLKLFFMLVCSKKKNVCHLKLCLDKRSRPYCSYMCILCSRKYEKYICIHKQNYTINSVLHFHLPICQVELLFWHRWFGSSLTRDRKQFMLDMCICLWQIETALFFFGFNNSYYKFGWRSRWA